ncbi:hypothetical protein [Kitasatospora sp. NPDC059571]|uniref:hypothetical protein n=1 Tax=Kitasatospora sp. NPDC059571 TaxID=3346871 RepID=UPI00368AF380
MGEQDAERPGEAGAADGAGQPENAGAEPKRAAAKLVFTDPLERQTSDDTDSGWGERPGGQGSGGRGLDWYLSQRPPHHGG